LFSIFTNNLQITAVERLTWVLKNMFVETENHVKTRVALQ